MAKIAVINSSFPAYNLAAERIRTKFLSQGHDVLLTSPRADFLSMGADYFLFSVVFTWDLPILCEDINNVRAWGKQFEVGGPAATAMPEYIYKKTGAFVHTGLDERFEHVNGHYKASFTSRGCPRACPFCLVSRLEGRHIEEYDDFPIPEGPNPFICDNNILATSWKHQQLVVKKLKGVRNLDINSGFDDRIFIKNPEKYWNLYSELDLEAFRFAYDSPEQRDVIKACADFLHAKGVDYRRIIVFCLIGGPGVTFEASRERLQYLIDIGTSPYPMQYRPLNWIPTIDIAQGYRSKTEYIPPGWYERDIEMLYSYYGVPYIWRSGTWKSIAIVA